MHGKDCPFSHAPLTQEQQARKAFERSAAERGVADPYARHNARTDLKRSTDPAKPAKAGKGKGKSGGGESSGGPGICQEFAKGGFCRFGDACRFTHQR